MRALIVIPARMAATRLPGKPLADIHGKPMIVRVAGEALRAMKGPVLVAAGDAEIAEAARKAGYDAVLTDPALPSGTDRIHEAVKAFDRSGQYEAIVNLQGDMPTIKPGTIEAAIRVLAEGQADIATLVSPSSAQEDRDNPNVVKAVMAMSAPDRGRALYFTRAAAPWGEGPIWRHVGLYVYRRAALDRFVAAPPSPLELREKLEQLRALEMGMSIEAGVVDDFPKGVDSPADLEAAREALKGRT